MVPPHPPLTITESPLDQQGEENCVHLPQHLNMTREERNVKYQCALENRIQFMTYRGGNVKV